MLSTLHVYSITISLGCNKNVSVSILYVEEKRLSQEKTKSGSS